VALNRELLGHTYAAEEPYEVTLGKLREFAAALGGELGPGVIAPPTFAFVASLRVRRMLLDDPTLGLRYGRVVHGEESFAYERPIRAGDVLTATATVTAIEERGGNELLHWEEELRDADGAIVCRTAGAIVSRGTAEGGS
jgi:acyl dehydratase